MRLLLCLLVGLAVRSTVSQQAYIIDGQAISRAFDGIGGVSGGGATSKLLISYAEPYRSRILDLLFQPRYGAALQILKVEIGGDDQTTDGTESSHMHEANDENYNRGYEWWLMKEAKKRNPAIKLYGLPWSFPGWLGINGNPYANPDRLANYTVRWINGAKTVHNLTIDYIGIWNEKNWDNAYIITLRRLLDSSGFANVKIIAPDGFAMTAGDFQRLFANATVKQSIYAAGPHYPGTHLPANARTDGIPLWSSEDYSTFNDDIGAGCWARILNQNFVNGNMTSTISWNLIASYYDDLPYKRNGLMTANFPWSGNYEVNNPIWVTAHTTHFVDIGWNYLVQNSGSGHLERGGSFVTLTDGQDFTIVIETMTHNHSICIRPYLNEYNVREQTARFRLLSPFDRTTTLNFFMTQFFFNGTTNQVVNSEFTLNIPIDCVITLSTRNSNGMPDLGQIPEAAPFPLPYADNFQGYNNNEEPKYLTPQKGVWEIINGNARQMVANKPVAWCAESADGPIAIIGNGTWLNVGVSARIRFPSSNSTATSAFVAVRTDCTGCIEYHLCRGVFLTVVRPQSLYLSADIPGLRQLHQETLSQPIALDQWFSLQLHVVGNVITYGINCNLKTLVTPGLPIFGFAGLGSRQYGITDWSDLQITPDPPVCINIP